MKVSFIVPTVERFAELRRCILSIQESHRRSTEVSIEIVVVSQGNNDAGITFSCGEGIRFFRINSRGLSKARNYGINNSRGDYLVFLDDDAQIASDFLENFSCIAVEYPGEAYCGRILAEGSRRHFTLCFKDVDSRFLGYSDYKWFMGSSHIIKRSVFQKLGYYDEDFGAGGKYFGAEESDLFFRMKSKGIRIRYSPELVFYHPSSENNSPVKVHSYNLAVGAMFRKQVMNDSRNLLLYLIFSMMIVVKNALRTAQVILFPPSIAHKDRQYHYRNALSGFIEGFTGYKPVNSRG